MVQSPSHVKVMQDTMGASRWNDWPLPEDNEDTRLLRFFATCVIKEGRIFDLASE
jgi:hypothetical protein